MPLWLCDGESFIWAGFILLFQRFQMVSLKDFWHFYWTDGFLNYKQPNRVTVPYIEISLCWCGIIIMSCFVPLRTSEHVYFILSWDFSILVWYANLLCLFLSKWSMSRRFMIDFYNIFNIIELMRCNFLLSAVCVPLTGYVKGVVYNLELKLIAAYFGFNFFPVNRISWLI